MPRFGLVLVGLCAFTAASAMPGDTAVWETLQKTPVRIECTTLGTEPWCRSSGIIDVPIDRLATTLEAMEKQADIFDSVLLIEMVEPDTAHVVIDFPAGMSDRDYVIKYTRSVDGDARVYSWVPVDHPAAMPTDDIVRLPRMAGAWRLLPAGSGTLVTYTWQSEVLGNLPSWALNVAWKKTGNEILKDLSGASGAALAPPS
jgi:hypothetical protein